jgi:hypothetical protein
MGRPPDTRGHASNGRGPAAPLRGALLKEVNDRIREVGDGSDLKDAGLEFLCECGMTGCVAQIPLAGNDYDRLRASGGVVLADGHAGR